MAGKVKLNEIFDKNTWKQQLIVFVGVFFMCFSAMGLGSNAFGQFTVPITEGLGMARTVYSMNETVSKVTGAIVAFFFSSVYRKAGPKAAVLIAGCSYALSYLSFAMAKDLTLVLVGGFFSGLGYTFAAQMTVFAIIPPWFKGVSGTVTAILSACNTFGTTFWTAFIQKWIKGFGYQQALIRSAIIMIVMCTISALLVKASPDDPLAGKKKGEVVEKDDKYADVPVLGNKDLIKLPHQWCLIFLYFIVAGTAHPFTANIAVFANSKGFEAATGAAAYALCYALMGPAKIVLGLIRDRFNAKVVILICYICYIIECLMVIFPIPESWYIAVGVTHGIAGCLSQLVIAYVVIETFGKYYHPGQLGLCLVVFNAGRAIGMPAVHIEFDKVGSYTMTMWIHLALCIVCTALAFAAMKFGKKWQAKRDEELRAQGLPVPGEKVA